ncbi:Protein 21.1 [Giardia lamblia P15]|uniref:Protein 21.1 n=1 Tax=Giardia intestinalis (strain P15) TaxID=658858 RepID=E1F505_GIAIA|nr:Protein 21.1 [Giardia lamblia P15]
MTLTSVRDWFCTVASGDLDAVRDNIDTYAGARSWNGDTALMVAARYNYSEVVRILAPIEHGLRNQDNYTALFIAINYDSIAAVEILVHYEAYLSIKERLTPLHYAVALNRISCIQPLMTSLGHERDAKGRIPTDLAYLMGHFDIAIFLSIRGYNCTPGVSSSMMIDHVHHFYKVYFEAAYDTFGAE